MHRDIFCMLVFRSLFYNNNIPLTTLVLVQACFSVDFSVHIFSKPTMQISCMCTSVVWLHVCNYELGDS